MLKAQCHGRLLRLECLPGARLQEEKNLWTAVLIYRSALNGSAPGAEENPVWILVSISDHWICPGPEEIPDGEPQQPAVLAVGILQSSPSPAQHLGGGGGDTGGTQGAHPSQSIQLSHHVLAAMRCCGEKDRHVKINSPQRASPGVPD